MKKYYYNKLANYICIKVYISKYNIVEDKLAIFLYNISFFHII